MTTFKELNLNLKLIEGLQKQNITEPTEVQTLSIGKILENKDLLVAFYAKCGKDENGKKVELAPVEPYGKIKKWFLDNNAEIADFNEKKKDILKKVS